MQFRHNSVFALRAIFSALVIAAALLTTGSARAAIIISEVDASGSSTSSNTYNADWFELTNTGAATVDISNWKMDDNTHASASAVPLRGVTSIAAGQSVVFVEGVADGSTDATINAAFKAFWFGADVPVGFTIGNYGGTSVSLSTTSDEVNIYDAGNAAVVAVGFGTSTAGVTFDNAAGLGNSNQPPNTTISTLSVAGTNGAFSSANVGSALTHETGSPGTIANAVPEPGSVLLLLVGVGLLPSSRRWFQR